VVECAFYDDLREKFKNVLMKEGIEFGEERKTEAGKKRLMQLLLGTGLQWADKEAAAKLRQETLNFCRGARAVVLRLTKEFEKRSFGSFVVLNLCELSFQVLSACPVKTPTLLDQGIQSNNQFNSIQFNSQDKRETGRLIASWSSEQDTNSAWTDGG
jgi:hypothetical protein